MARSHMFDDQPAHGMRHLQVSLDAYMLYVKGESPSSQVRGFNGVHHRPAWMLPAMSG